MVLHNHDFKYVDHMTRQNVEIRSAFVHAQLREDVLQGLLPPGSRLPSAELAERFSVSQAVVREALARLTEQGLAVAVPQQGSRVRPLSITDLEELTDARVELETLVLRRAITYGDLVWESSAAAAHHQLVNTPTQRPAGDLNRVWFSAHEDFHRSILRGCGNERLYEAAVTLRDSASLYRWWSRPVGGDHARDVGREHQQIVDAVLARDEQRAGDLLADHIRRTSDALRDVAVRDLGGADGTPA